MTRISQVIEYDRGQPLKPVIDTLVELRREGDKSEDTKLLAMVSLPVANFLCLFWQLISSPSWQLISWQLTSSFFIILASQNFDELVVWAFHATER